ncbi:DUF3800 domain-containing protein [Kribbella turkmenica]|uniref:DUF3800 domain-containing protein n=1 Tax=Kribbella turkmenica TaxID=2530375 RepID=A0A4R4XH34_9ACTN|nr:DUF3800 domain-containing protein [Kribbella turkmenica]TDD29792.1 DUF3800 domain-containing protein [Kribbella turkmenica]
MHTLPTRAWIEIACDESGFSGSNLLDPGSPVITHAGVDLAVPEAAEVVAVLRSSLRRRGSTEYKSNLLLRPEQRLELEWFLTALCGRAHVHVIDKTWYLARRVIELLVAEPSYGAGLSLDRDHYAAALDVYRAPGRTAFLDAFVAMTRTKRLKLLDNGSIDRFFETVPAGVPALREVTRAHVEAVLLRLIDDDPAIPPPLEPMVPALAETALFWSAGHRSVAVVHDEQSALTRHRLARLRTYLAGAAFPAPPPLLTVTQVDSRHDPRVQVADLLAGIARRLHKRPSRLLRPYLVGGPPSLDPPTGCDQPAGWRV